MKVAAVQMVSGPDVGDNLRMARDLVKQAQDGGAELALLPEYFSSMGLDERDKLGQAEAYGAGRVQEFLARTAQESGLWIVGGSLPLRGAGPDRVRNSSLAFSPSGNCVARYDKVHLFRLSHGQEQFDEARTIEPGGEAVQFTLTDRSGRAWCVGLSICYDLRFPELYRLHANAGADLLLVPAAFTFTTGQAHWELLLRARAVENQAYLLASAQGGVHPSGRRTWGHSMALDPWGLILGQRPGGVGLVIAEVTRERLHTIRERLPALAHRQF